jgi:hypothetical protein
VGEDNVQTFKSLFGIVQAAVPVLYCGYLLYYFFDVGGSVQDIEDMGLGPTMLGLGVVALLFCIPLVLKIVRMFGGPRAPKPRGNTPSDDDGDGGAAADAIIARYMARKALEDAMPSAPAPQSGGGANHPSFGRKNG